MSTMMNGFYALKAFRRNQPINFADHRQYADIGKQLRDQMHPAQAESRVPVHPKLKKNTRRKVSKLPIVDR